MKSEHPLEAWHRLVRKLDTDFKVMLRPLKAINLIQQRMAQVLQAGPPR